MFINGILLIAILPVFSVNINKYVSPKGNKSFYETVNHTPNLVDDRLKKNIGNIVESTIITAPHESLKLIHNDVLLEENKLPKADISIDCYESDRFKFEEKSTPPFVKELKRVNNIDILIRQITEKFISTLKTNKGWLDLLLNYIKREQIMRTVNKCHTDICLYKISCYISKRFMKKAWYFDYRNRKSVNNFLFEKIIRYPRSIKTNHVDDQNHDLTHNETKIVNSTFDHNALEANQYPQHKKNPAYVSIKNSHNDTTPPENNLFNQFPIKLNNTVKSNISNSKIDPIHVERMPFTDNGTLLKELPDERLEPPEKASSLLRERKSNFESDLLFSSSVNSNHDPMVNCTGIYAEYCYNSISCLYVSVLETPVCFCKPGYTGVRCDLYNLPQTINTLSKFRNSTVDIERLNPADSNLLYSVLEATACYTYNTVLDDNQ